MNVLLFMGYLHFGQSQNDDLMHIVPMPQHVMHFDGTALLDLRQWGRPTVYCDESLLVNICSRFLQRLRKQTGIYRFDVNPSHDTGAVIGVKIQGTNNTYPDFGVDESYEMTTDATVGVRIRAQTVFGARHALESLLQLIGIGATVPVLHIIDRPRFMWRGLMLDVVRHWMPLELVLRIVDTMAAAKFNVLHLHLTDDQAIRVESRSFPELTARTTRHGEFYTRADVATLVEHARVRGIRIVPEFNVPAHARSWLAAMPEKLLRTNVPLQDALPLFGSELPNLLDPSLNATWVLLEHFLDDMTALFPDRYWHMGGDEPNFAFWLKEPAIVEFARARGLGHVKNLLGYFSMRLHKMLVQRGKLMIQWEESAIGTQARPGAVAFSSIESVNNEVASLAKSDLLCHVWYRAEYGRQLAAAKVPMLVSAGFYMDFNANMRSHYDADPLLRAPEQSPLAFGGEAAFWTEWMTQENIEARMWPRTATVAERLWSPASQRSFGSFLNRLQYFDTFVSAAGSQHHAQMRAMLSRLACGIYMPALATLITALKPVELYPWMGAIDQQTPLVDLENVVQGGASLEAELFVWRIDQVVAHQGLGVHAPHIRAALVQWSEVVPKAGCPSLASAHEISIRVASLARDALAVLSQHNRTICDSARVRLAASRKPYGRLTIYILDPISRLFGLVCSKGKI